MAERRMFAKTIVLSDAFLDLPMSARCLYFTLGMLADDDGFVNAPRAIMRQCGASDDDMKNLIAKKFVLVFESGVIVIKHWRINNYLRNDRYAETKYTEEKAQLSVDEKGGYHRGNDSGIPGGIPNNGIPNIGIPSIGKDSIDKVSLGQVSIGKGECERGNPPAPSPAPAEKPASPVLTDEERRKRILHWKHSVEIFRRQKYDPGRIYDLAAAEGITQEEIDNFKEDAS